MKTKRIFEHISKSSKTKELSPCLLKWLIPAGVALAGLVLLFVSMWGQKQSRNVPVAFSLPTEANYEMGSFGLWKWSAEGFAVTDGYGVTIPIGRWTDVRSSGGILFCKNEGSETRHFALNARNGGVWVEGQDFFDDRTEVTSFGDASLIPQRDARTGKLGYLNRQQVWFIPPRYLHDDYERECFSDGVALPLDWDTRERLFLTEDGQSAPLCDLGSGWLSEFGQFHDGLMRIKQEYSGYQNNGEETALYQFLTKDNTPLQPGIRYGNARDFSEGLAAVQKDGLWGFIDTNGDVAIEFQYSVAGDFHEGRAAVSNQQSNLFYIDKTGTRVSQPIVGYEFTGEARGGLFKVSLPEGGFGLMDENGTLVSERPLDYRWDDNAWYAFPGTNADSMVVVLPNGVNLYSDYFFRFYGNVCVGKTSEKDVLYSMETGEKLKTARSIGYFREGLAFCHDGLRCGYLDKNGQWIISSWQLLPGRTKHMWPEERVFYGGLALANYNGQNVMLYNPLIYKDGWTADEFDRAVSLGLGNAAMDERELTVDGLLTLVEEFQVFVQGHLEDGVFSTKPTFRAKEDYLTAEHGGQITREELAVCLCRLAEDLGENTRNYAGFYADQDAIIYPGEVNYTASLALFDVENNIFAPRGGVSQREAVILFLRFAEAML